MTGYADLDQDHAVALSMNLGLFSRNSYESGRNRVRQPLDNPKRRDGCYSYVYLQSFCNFEFPARNPPRFKVDLREAGGSVRLFFRDAYEATPFER
jgi:hypothetical protein